MEEQKKKDEEQAILDRRRKEIEAKKALRSNLDGVKVAHDLDEFNEGEEVILTLNREKGGVLGNRNRFLRDGSYDNLNDEDEEEDELVNADLLEKERIQKNLKTAEKAKKPAYDRYAAAEGKIHSILSQYDDELEEEDPVAAARAKAKKGFVLSSSGSASAATKSSTFSSASSTLAMLAGLSEPIPSQSKFNPTSDLLDSLYGEDTSTTTQGSFLGSRLDGTEKDSTPSQTVRVVNNNVVGEDENDMSSSLFKKKKRTLKNKSITTASVASAILQEQGLLPSHVPAETSALHNDTMAESGEIVVKASSSELVGIDTSGLEQGTHLGSRKSKTNLSHGLTASAMGSSPSDDFAALAQRRLVSLQDASYLKALQRAEHDTHKLFVGALKTSVALKSTPKEAAAQDEQMTDSVSTEGGISESSGASTLKPSSLPPGMSQKVSYLGAPETSVAQRIAEQRKARQAAQSKSISESALSFKEANEASVAVEADASSLAKTMNGDAMDGDALTPFGTVEKDGFSKVEIAMKDEDNTANTNTTIQTQETKGVSAKELLSSFTLKSEAFDGIKEETDDSVVTSEDISSVMRDISEQKSLEPSSAFVESDDETTRQDSTPALGCLENPNGMENNHDWHDGFHRRGTGMILEYVRQHGILSKLAQTRADGRARDFDVELDTKDGVDLNYYDDAGNRLTTKEAQRFLSAKFHGIAPSLNKQEKILKRRETAAQQLRKQFGGVAEEIPVSKRPKPRYSKDSKPAGEKRGETSDSVLKPKKSGQSGQPGQSGQSGQPPSIPVVGTVRAGPQYNNTIAAGNIASAIRPSTLGEESKRDKIQVSMLEPGKKQRTK